MKKWFGIFGKVALSIVLFLLFVSAFLIIVSIFYLLLAAMSLILMYLLITTLGILCLGSYLDIVLAMWGW